MMILDSGLLFGPPCSRCNSWTNNVSHSAQVAFTKKWNTFASEKQYPKVETRIYTRTRDSDGIRTQLTL